MTSPFEYFGMALAPLTILYNFAKKYNKKRVTKDRLFSAIEIEYSEFKKKLNEIEKKNKIIIDYLDIIEKESNDYIASELVVYSSLQFKLYSDLITSYIRLTKAIKELSVNVSLMEDIKELNGFLFDFIFRISETFIEPDKIHITNEYIRLLKSHEKKIYGDIKTKDIEKLNNKFKKYDKIMKFPFKNSLIIMNRKRQIDQKYIKNDIINNLKELNSTVKKIKIDISEEYRQLAPLKLIEASIIMQEIKKIEKDFKKPTTNQIENLKKK